MKKKPWTRPRHRAVKALLRPFFTVATALKYHCAITPFDEDGRNYLVLCNHQTDFDQFIVSLMFRKPVYFVAMEDLFSRGLVSSIIRWCAAPIPIMKGSHDVGCVMNCIRVAKEGGSVCIFPEGNRTYGGRTCYIRPQIAKLARTMKLPIAIVRLEGGFCMKPRWADKARKGAMQAYVSRVIEPDEYQQMDNDALYEAIRNELYVDDTMTFGKYTGRHLAEGIERALHYCPDCGASTFTSEGNEFTCTKCGRAFRYLPDQRIEAVDGGSCPGSISKWYDEQEAFIRSLDLSPWMDRPLWTDTVDVSEVIPKKRKVRLVRGTEMRLYGDRIEFIDGGSRMTWEFKDIQDMTCVACHKLNVYHNSGLFQVEGFRGFNALKYCNIYYHARYLEEENNGEFQFLGL